MELIALISCFTHVTLFLNVLTDFPAAHGYGSGAPDTPGVCDQLTPNHIGFSAQSTPSPYRISTSSATYRANQTISVTIQGGDFRGFLLQAQQNGNPTARLGTFRTTGVVRLACNSTGQGSTATHTDNLIKSDLSVAWTAPLNATGDVIFKATIVQTKSTFWVAIQSSVVTGPLPPGNDVDTTTCGSQKSCYRFPAGCSNANCSYVLTWVKTSAGVAYELSADVGGPSSYVSMGLSKDVKMGDDSVTSCIYNSPSNRMDVRMLWNAGHVTTPLSNDAIGLVPGSTSGGYSNGRTYCRFTRIKDAPPTTGSTTTSMYYPGTESYYALMAKGTVTGGAMNYHANTRVASSTPYNFAADTFTSGDTSGAVTQLFPFVRVYGVLIVWMVLAVIRQ